MEKSQRSDKMTDDIYLDQILNDMQNGVLAVDGRGTVLYINPKMNSFLELESAKGETLFSLMERYAEPKNDDFWNCIVDVIFNHSTCKQTKAKYVSPSGREYSFLVTSSYLSSDSGDGSGERGVVLTVSDETERDMLERKKHDSVAVLIGILALVCATVLVSSLYTFTNGAFPHTWIARFTEISGFILMVVFLKYTSLTVRDFGIVSKAPWREVGQSLVVAAVMIAVMAGAKLVMVNMQSPLFPSGQPFFDFSAPPRFYYITYIFVVFMQELLTRCGLQKSLNKILESKHKDLISVLLTTVMFMAVHLQHGLIYMLGAGILNAILATVYNKHNGILGTCIVHYAFGIGGLVLQWIE